MKYKLDREKLLKERILKARANPGIAGSVATYLRFKRGMNYQETYEYFKNILGPDYTVDDHDQLMQEADHEMAF